MNYTLKPHINNGNIERHEVVYEYLFNTYYARLCSYALRYVESNDLAEDIVSDTFFKMWQKGNVKITTSIQSYLFKAVYNNCMYYIRQQSNEQKTKRSLQERFEKDYPVRLLDDFTERDSLILNEIDDALNAAINKLPKQAKIVFVQKRYEGLKNKEIAEKIGVSIKTVEMHMTRAMLFLKNELKDFHPFFFAFYVSLIQ